VKVSKPQSTKKCTQPVFRNWALKRAVRTSGTLWCHNEAVPKAPPTGTHHPTLKDLVSLGIYSISQKTLRAFHCKDCELNSRTVAIMLQMNPLGINCMYLITTTSALPEDVMLPCNKSWAWFKGSSSLHWPDVLLKGSLLREVRVTQREKRWRRA